jgi:hypothetical protein
MRDTLFKILFFFTIVLMAGACANMGFPTGGPKDEEPPHVKKSSPPADALNFQGKKISIEFNELIQVKEVSQKLVVSPPMNKKPYVVARGKTLLIEFDEELQPNTTYTLDFADAVSDFNEGNVIPSFRFSFSTGETVDSLEVAGHLFEAEDLSPADGILVMLYDNLADSAFKTRVPVRMAKTDLHGHFSIHNVRPGKYRIYALDDHSNSYKFTNPGDRIAWLDSIIEPSFENKMVLDSVTVNIDSMTIDTVVYKEKLVYTPDSLLMFLFQEDYKQQFLVSNDRPEKAKLVFIFNRPLEKELQVDITGHETDHDWLMAERSFANDTVTCWIKDSALYNRDSLSFTLVYQMKDSMNRTFDKVDTISMYYFKQEVAKKKKKKKKAAKKEVPHLKIGKFASNVNVYAANSFQLPAPAVRFDRSAVKLMQVVDTVQKEVKFDFWQDTLNIRKYYILHKWEPGGDYVMTIDSAAIEDIYHHINFPISKKFRIKKLEDYGKIYVQLDAPGENWLLQVLSGTKEKIVQQGYVPENGKIAFQYLTPGDYMLRIVIDENRNGQWDTGNYDKKIQPEKIIYYPARISLRANWDLVVPQWLPEDFDIYRFSEKFRKPSSSKHKNN